MFPRGRKYTNSFRWSFTSDRIEEKARRHGRSGSAVRYLFGGERNRLRDFEDAPNEFSALQVEHRPGGRNTRSNERTDVATQKRKSDFLESEVNDGSERVEDLRFRLRSFK